MNKKPIWNTFGACMHGINRVTFLFQKNSEKIIRFDTSVGTDNLGDFIIMHYCKKILEEIFPDREFVSIGTHRLPSAEEEQLAKKTKYKFVCGTNLLTSHIERYWQWILPEGVRRKLNYRDAILLGVGWNGYQDDCSAYSRMIYRSILNANVIHSVRDQYAFEKLHKAGIRNVINTGCPTTWALTPEFCEEIPTQKAAEVVATITDYRRDPEKDEQMLQILSRNYDRIHLWLQGREDEAYLQTLKIPENLVTIPSSLEAYEEVLKKGNVDYVGTRLHAGIHALNHKVRSVILAVDNRATEMARDICLPVIQRQQIGEFLEKQIQSDFTTEIRINQENIDTYKRQFRR